jgi:hypothetical protein
VSGESTYDAVRLEEARRYYKQIAFSSLSVVESAPGKLLFTDADGVQYRTASILPGPDSPDVAYTIDGSGRLLFLKRRGEVGVAA